MQRLNDVEFARTRTRSLRMDIVSSETAGLKPGVLWLHGGGWYSGNRSTAIDLGMFAHMVEAGIAVATADYRLSGEALFPAQLDDTLAALRFLRDSGPEVGIDPTCLAIVGFSSGGHLAALTAFSDRRDVPLRAVIALAPPTDFLANPRATDPHLNPHAHEGIPCAEHQLLGGPVLEHAELARTANPAAYVTAGAPPCLIVHGDEDEVVPLSQSELLYAALTASRVPAVLLVVTDGNHGLWKAGEPYTQPGFPPGIDAVMVEFLLHHMLGGPPPPVSGRVERPVADFQ